MGGYLQKFSTEQGRVSGELRALHISGAVVPWSIPKLDVLCGARLRVEGDDSGDKRCHAWKEGDHGQGARQAAVSASRRGSVSVSGAMANLMQFWHTFGSRDTISALSMISERTTSHLAHSVMRPYTSGGEDLRVKLLS